MIIIVSATVAVIFTLLAKKLALKLSIVDRPGELKIHGKPIPYLGGIAIFVTVLLVSFFINLELSWLFWGFAALLSCIGLIDDINNLPSKIRFFLESFILIVYVLVDGYVILAPMVVSITLVYLFFMGTINSVNWMDGMDGLLAGISIIVSSGFLWLAHSLGHPWLPQFTLVVIGALLGFLIFNFHPAKIFLGDAGSYFIGFTFFYMSMELLKFAFSWRLFFTILGLLSVFIVDSTIAVIRRVRNGLHPFHGDRSHIYDQIYKRTGNYLVTVFLMYLLAGLGIVVGLITYSLPDGYWIVFWVSSAIAAYFILFKLKFVSVTLMSANLETIGEKS